MLHTNTYQHQLMTHERLMDCLERAEVDCLCNEAGLENRGLVACMACRLLSGLGCILVAAGRRLEGLSAQPPARVGRLSSATNHR